MNRKYIKVVAMGMLSLMPFWELHAQDVCEAGFYGGTNMSKLDERFYEYDKAWGGQAGFDMKVGSKWCQFEGQLGYVAMGSRYKESTEVGIVDSGTKQVQNWSYKAMGHYLDVPLSVAFGWWDIDPDEGGFGFTVSGGVYMEIGLAGKTKLTSDITNYSYNVADETFTEEYSGKFFGDGPSQFKRFNAGWTVGAKMALGPVFRIGASYRHGLLDIGHVNGRKVTRNSFFLNLSFVFAND